jgi:hypothetical protein
MVAAGMAPHTRCAKWQQACLAPLGGMHRLRSLCRTCVHRAISMATHGWGDWTVESLHLDVGRAHG